MTGSLRASFLQLSIATPPRDMLSHVSFLRCGNSLDEPKYKSMKYLPNGKCEIMPFGHCEMFRYSGT
ncbi:MAG: hypothetical protein ACI3VA_12860, partial [Candidatus Limivicinus sp.]